MQAEIPLWLVITVVAIALLVGAAMIAVVTAKYAIHQWFHLLGGPTLATLGVALIGLTVYGNITLKAGDFEAELRSVRASLETSQREVASLYKARDEAGVQLKFALDAVMDAGEFVSDGRLSDDSKKELTQKFRAAQQNLLRLNDHLTPGMAAIDGSGERGW